MRLSRVSGYVKLRGKDMGMTSSRLHTGMVWLATGFLLCTGALGATAFAQGCPTVVGQTLSNGNGHDVSVSGDYAYLAAHSGGVGIIDVTDPANPVEVGTFHRPDIFAIAVDVQGDFVYAVDYHSGLVVIDVSTPSEPVEVGLYADTSIKDVAVSGDFAYLAGIGRGLRVLDVSDPSLMVEVGSVDTIHGGVGVTLSGAYAYVPSLDNLRIVDVSDPTAPVEVGYFIFTSGNYDVAVSGGYAYLAETHGMLVVDVSDPTAPVQVGSYEHPGVQGYGVALASSYAYMSVDGLLLVLDVSDPTAPVQVASYQPVYLLRIAASGEHVFAADFMDGLTIFRGCTVFADGFESGGTSAWTSTVP